MCRDMCSNNIHFLNSAMGNRYDGDVLAWAMEQAAHLRAGNWAALDVVHIAEEIDDVGRSVRRECKSRMTVLLAHLLKWQEQPGRRSKSWVRTIRHQRHELADLLDAMPSLLPDLSEKKWWTSAWEGAVSLAHTETGLDDFPDACPWSLEQVRDPDFYPD
jgi:hypothetical protein